MPASSRWPAGPGRRRALVRRYYMQFGILVAVLVVLLVAAVVFALTQRTGHLSRSPVRWVAPGAVAVLLVLPTLASWRRVKAQALSVPELEATDDEVRISRVDGLRSSVTRARLDHVVWLMQHTSGPGYGELELRDRSGQLLATWLLTEEIGPKVVRWLEGLGYHEEHLDRAESRKLAGKSSGVAPRVDFYIPVRTRHGKVVPADQDASHRAGPGEPVAPHQPMGPGGARAGQGPGPLLQGWEGPTGLVFYYFVAASPEAAAGIVLAPGGPAAQAGTVAVNEVEPVVHLGNLEEILTGVPYDQVIDGAAGRPAPGPERTGDWVVLGTSPELQRKLCRLGPAQRRVAAEKWSATEEMKGVDPDRLAEVVDALCGLCRLADRRAEMVYAAALPQTP